MPKLELQGLLLFGFFAEVVKLSAAFLSNTAGASCWKSNYCGSKLLELEPLGASHCRCDIIKKQESYFEKGKTTD